LGTRQILPGAWLELYRATDHPPFAAPERVVIRQNMVTANLLCQSD
jgi:hypothetical protein